MIKILHLGDASRGRYWKEIINREMPQIDFQLWEDCQDFSMVEYLVAWTLSSENIEKLPNLKIIFSVGAGIDQLNLDLIPPNVRIVRMIETGITTTMCEYVTMAVLALHRDIINYVDEQRREIWNPKETLFSSERNVAIMGLGELGQAALKYLAPLGFKLRGWSRSKHQIENVECFAGDSEFDDFLSEADILVCLLPLTPETRGILCRETFDKMPRGAGIINVGRGAHLISQDLLDALNDGQIGSAFLDVFWQEPLPKANQIYHHPKIFMTPHTAGVTRMDTAIHSLVGNLKNLIIDGKLEGEVERKRGY